MTFSGMYYWGTAAPGRENNRQCRLQISFYDASSESTKTSRWGGPSTVAVTQVRRSAGVSAERWGELLDTRDSVSTVTVLVCCPFWFWLTTVCSLFFSRDYIIILYFSFDKLWATFLVKTTSGAQCHFSLPTSNTQAGPSEPFFIHELDSKTFLQHSQMLKTAGELTSPIRVRSCTVRLGHKFDTLAHTCTQINAFWLPYIHFLS